MTESEVIFILSSIMFGFFFSFFFLSFFLLSFVKYFQNAVKIITFHFHVINDTYKGINTPFIALFADLEIMQILSVITRLNHS